MSTSGDLFIDQIFIGGTWVDPSSDETIEVTESSTGQCIGRVPSAKAADVARAVDAAAACAPIWSEVPVAERARMVAALGEALEKRCEELAVLESREIGTPILESREGQVLQAVEFLKSTVEEVNRIDWLEQARTAMAVRVPFGVVGAITAWNFPLQIVAAKVGAALSAGCSVVVKASELAPLGVFELAREVAAIGFPPGAVNILTGYGYEAGQALAAHPDVDKLTFTGSVPTAKAIARTAADALTALHLELGGKSASIVLDDANLDEAVRGSLANAFQGSGQVCCATTRILVPKERLAQAEEIAADAIQNDWPVGDPLTEEARIGPLVSQGQQARVAGYVRDGIDSGARLVAEGRDMAREAPDGFFVAPTVFSCSNDHRIAREEIFGPVAVLVAYDGGPEGAIAMANDSPYGLGGAVWSTDRDSAVAVAKRLRTGQVEVNGAIWDGTAPFGGLKQSGYGRENGKWGIEEFTTWTAVHV